MQEIEIVVERKHNSRVDETWEYKRRNADTDDVWVVRGPTDDEWEPFADATASERTVRQLLRKEHSVLY